MDGNKRVAVTMTAAFLREDGYGLKFGDHETFVFLNRVYQTGHMRFAELETWLRAHTVLETPAG